MSDQSTSIFGTFVFEITDKFVTDIVSSFLHTNMSSEWSKEMKEVSRVMEEGLGFWADFL